MNSIPRVSLEDTLNLIQLARETALSKGQQQQAERMSSVADQMRTLVTNTRQASASKKTDAAGVLGQSDFKKLMGASQAKETAQKDSVSSTTIIDRNRLVNAMSASGMSDLEIARQFGISRDEVRLVINLQSKGKFVVNSEVWK
jgi:hypothetical protein